VGSEEKLDCEEGTDRGFDPRSTPRWRLKKTKSVYLDEHLVNALDVSSGAGGVRYPAGRRLWIPRDEHYHLVIGRLVPQKAA
jgi:hypothetical protein